MVLKNTAIAYWDVYTVLLLTHILYVCVSVATQTKLQTDHSTPPRQSVLAIEMTSQRRSSISSQVGTCHHHWIIWNLVSTHKTHFNMETNNNSMSIDHVCRPSSVDEFSEHRTDDGSISCVSASAASTTSAQCAGNSTSLLLHSLLSLLLISVRVFECLVPLERAWWSMYVYT